MNLFQLLLQKLSSTFQLSAREAGYDSRLHGRESSTPYVERPEFGSRNLAIKLERAAAGGPFEWPDITALNKTVAELARPYKRIVELGGGTGLFAVTRGSMGDCEIVCSEMDAEASDWASTNRNLPNITYTTEFRPERLGHFDAVVSIEVIEHIADFRDFLTTCTRLAPTAIITTPNKSRTYKDLTTEPPAYEQHVREWTAGEFYWVLRCFYRHVELHAMPNPRSIGSVKISILASMSPLIALCSDPY